MTIDVQVFHDKLEVLKEYLHGKIDNIGKSFWIDINSIPHMNPEWFLQMYAETALIFHDGNPPPIGAREMTFEEFYNQKTKIQITLNK